MLLSGRAAYAVGVGVVLVGIRGEAQGAAGIVESGGHRQPFLALVAAHGDGAGVAVEVVAAEVQVVFQTPEVGQHFGERPFVVAPDGPVVVVLGDAAEQHLAVDAAGAAHSLAAGDDDGFILLGSAPGGVAPAVGVGAVGGTPDVVALFEVNGQVLKVGIVGAGFQEQRGHAGVLGEAGGQGAAGGTPADDDVVVLHSVSVLKEVRNPVMVGAGRGRAPAGIIAPGGIRAIPMAGARFGGGGRTGIAG